MLPPIRYPLPTLAALVLASLLAWQAAAWSVAWRAEAAARMRRALEGPPVPSSSAPKVVVGPIVRRALLLRDSTPVSTRPKGSATEAIDRRMFVDVYDEWPEPGPITHLRVGNRRPIGWIAAVDALSWDTRLVVRPPGGRVALADSPGGSPSAPVEVGRHSLPVLAWKGDAVELAVWDPSRPWSGIARRGWARLADLPAGSWGVWISQVELPILLRMAIDGDPATVRLRALLGRLTDNRTISEADLAAARAVLPPAAFAPGADPAGAADRLAEANARAESEAGWSGLSFRFLPLGDLP